jgi:hypothetical protein
VSSGRFKVLGTTLGLEVGDKGSGFGLALDHKAGRSWLENKFVVEHAAAAQVPISIRVRLAGISRTNSSSSIAAAIPPV